MEEQQAVQLQVVQEHQLGLLPVLLSGPEAAVLLLPLLLAVVGHP